MSPSRSPVRPDGTFVRGVRLDANQEYVGGFFDLLNPYALLGRRLPARPCHRVLAMPSVGDVVRALGEFVERLDQFDPDAVVIGVLSVGGDGAVVELPLRLPVARALVEALASYHDPRDYGACAHCRAGRLDEHFVCRDCGIINGVFGQMLAERATRGGPAVDEPPR